MNIQKAGGRIPVDPRVIERIQRSPYMVAEQGSGFMEDWGGPSTYKEMCGLTSNQRLVWSAVLEGATDYDQIEILTGLTPSEISRTVSELESQGKVTVEAEALP